MPAEPSAQPEAPQRAVSNDLLPKSGSFEAKPKRANQLPPHPAPIELAPEPSLDEAPVEPTPPLVPETPLEPVRPKRRRHRERPIIAYMILGLAVGMGLVLAYWAYWHLPFGHR